MGLSPKLRPRQGQDARLPRASRAGGSTPQRPYADRMAADSRCGRRRTQDRPVVGSAGPQRSCFTKTGFGPHRLLVAAAMLRNRHDRAEVVASPVAFKPAMESMNAPAGGVTFA